MTKPNGVENVNWKAFGLLIALLIPVMGGLFSMGFMMGDLNDIPDELKAIHQEVAQVRVEMAALSQDVAALKAKSE